MQKTNGERSLGRNLRLPEVLDKSGLSKAEIYRRIKRNEFPRPVSLGRRSVAWREEDLITWMNALVTRGAK